VQLTLLKPSPTNDGAVQDQVTLSVPAPVLIVPAWPW